MYNLNNDPGEITNLAEEELYKKKKNHMRGSLELWLDKTGWKGTELKTGS